MAFQKKTWADRIAEFITRRTLTYEDNTTAVVTVERNEGEVSQTGDAFSAENMNDLENRINDAFAEINTNLSDSIESLSAADVKSAALSGNTLYLKNASGTNLLSVNLGGLVLSPIKKIQRGVATFSKARGDGNKYTTNINVSSVNLNKAVLVITGCKAVYEGAPQYGHIEHYANLTSATNIECGVTLANYEACTAYIYWELIEFV